MCEAGTSEYTIGTTLHWSDNALQDVLDKRRIDLIHEYLTPLPVVGTGGTSIYYDYLAPRGYLEATSGGTTIFYLQNGGGTQVGTSLWSADYRRGIVTFATSTAGSTMYLTARAYDLNGAAADVWQRKAAHYAPTSFNFSTDNHNISREQVYTHCQEMATFFQSISNNGMQTVDRYRSDM